MKIMHRLTIKGLKMNKSRTIATFIAIALSMTLITIIANTVVGLKESSYDFYIKHNGNYDVSFVMKEPTKENIEKLRLNRDAEEVYLCQDIGVAPFTDSTSKFRKNIFIKSCSENYFEKCYNFSLKEGRYPQKPDEVVLSKDFVDYSSKKYKVGDELTLDIGTYHAEYETDTGEIKDHILGLDDVGISYYDSEFVKSFKKTYKIVGILESDPYAGYDFNYHVNIYGYTDLSDNISSALDEWEYSKNIYVKVNNENVNNGTKDNSIYFISDITGISGVDIYNELYGFDMYDFDDDEEEQKKVQKELEQCEFHIIGVSVNDYLHDTLKTYKTYESVIFYVGLGIILLVMAASVFIIKNSFAISVTEKTVMYGKLSTVGATPKQIRNSIFFEGFILGIFGIVAGLIIGIVGSAASVMVVNNLFLDMLSGAYGGFKLIFSVSWEAMAAAVVLGAATIFLSALAAAVRASKISPIEAVRNNKEIRINKNKKNVFKSPKWVSRIFGAGGKIAWKNMKRSKRQYRTVIVSIIVSVSIFIGIFSFVNYSLYTYSSTIMHYNYNMTVEINALKDDGSYMSFDEMGDTYSEIAKYDEIDDYSYKFGNHSYFVYDIPDSKLPKNINDYYNTIEYKRFPKIRYSEKYGFTDDVYGVMEPNSKWKDISNYANLVAFDTNNYKKLLESLGYSYDEMKDKAILVNVNEAGKAVDGDISKLVYKRIKYMEDPVGYTLDMRYHLYDDENGIYLPEEKHLELEIGGEITDLSAFKDWIIRDELGFGTLIVSKEWLWNNHPYKNCIYSTMNIFSSDPAKTEQRLGEEYDNIYLRNIAGEVGQMNSAATLVQYIVYAIIAVISLIAITNIFNTVTTNMKLRQKEFAMLRSVGMTKREFSRMITLECAFYTVKALIIGIITGIICTVAIHFLFEGMWDADRIGKALEFIFPWQAVLISIAAVVALVFITTCFSKVKLNKQNIIETIRNDNI